MEENDAFSPASVEEDHEAQNQQQVDSIDSTNFSPFSSTTELSITSAASDTRSSKVKTSLKVAASRIQAGFVGTYEKSTKHVSKRTWLIVFILILIGLNILFLTLYICLRSSTSNVSKHEYSSMALKLEEALHAESEILDDEKESSDAFAASAFAAESITVANDYKTTFLSNLVEEAVTKIKKLRKLTKKYKTQAANDQTAMMALKVLLSSLPVTETPSPAPGGSNAGGSAGSPDNILGDALQPGRGLVPGAPPAPPGPDQPSKKNYRDSLSKKAAADAVESNSDKVAPKSGLKAPASMTLQSKASIFHPTAVQVMPLPDSPAFAALKETAENIRILVATFA